MMPAAIYPIPDSAYVAVLVVFLIAAATLPLYWLLVRPVGGRAAWDLGDIIALSILFLFTWPIVAGLVGLTLPLTLATLSWLAVTQNALLTAIPVYVAIARYRLPGSTLGLRVERWPWWLALGLLGGAIAIPLSFAGESAAVYVAGLIEGPAQVAARVAMEHGDDPLRPVLETLRGVPATVWLFLMLAVIVPIGEETFFRGFVYGGLRRRWGVVVAVVVSAVFFAAVHQQIVHGVPIFFLGILFALLYERTQSLLPGIVAHGANNIIAVLAALRGWNI